MRNAVHFNYRSQLERSKKEERQKNEVSAEIKREERQKEDGRSGNVVSAEYSRSTSTIFFNYRYSSVGEVRPIEIFPILFFLISYVDIL